MSLVQQRERRSNAGNRMRALLDKEADMEELFEMGESDDEAFSEIDEAVDTVDSDFDLDESEGEAEQEQLAEEEEKQIRISERQNKRQQQILQKTTRAPAISKTQSVKVNKSGRPSKKQQQETARQHSLDLSSRQSLRTKTILNRMQVEEQLRESEFKKALLPKRIRPEVRHMTQEELLAEAAITEEENRASLEQWQQKEADRQAKAKIKVKRGIQGPFVRYHSITDGPKQLVQPRKLLMIMDDQDGKLTQVDMTDPALLDYHYRRDVEDSGIATKNLITFFPNDDNNTNDMLQHIKTDGLTDRELDRLDRVPQLASWADRSPRFIKPLPCPITGKEARYREPVTYTPYATAQAYENIKHCLGHNYIWSTSMGIYTGTEMDSQGADGVPEGWDRMMLGKRPGEDDWLAPFPPWMAKDISHSNQQESSKPTRKKHRQRT
ncbi:YL1 nuclear protein-domain-containing protein [Chlamydoabsidia padenii]|nr:YL1 nuclear protein-domain-containing protein [Chlamydoabsidia padenii]